MPWEGVTVDEQRKRFIEDYQLNCYSVVELAERFGVSRKTANKWINRFKRHGHDGYLERSRRPHSCPRQTEEAIVEELVALREAHPRWGPRKLLELMKRRDPSRHLPAVSTAARILSREGSGEASAALPAGASWLPEEHPSGAERHMGRRLQGPIQVEERELFWASMRILRSHWRSHSSISGRYSGSMGCPIGCGRIMECPLP